MKNNFKKSISLILSFTMLVTCGMKPAHAFPPISMFKEALETPCIKSVLKTDFETKYLSPQQLDDDLKNEIKSFERMSPGLFKVNPKIFKEISPRILVLLIRQLNNFLGTHPNILQFMLENQFSLTIESNDGLGMGVCAQCKNDKNKITIMLNSIFLGNADIWWHGNRIARTIIGSHCPVDNNRMIEAVFLHEIGHMAEHIHMYSRAYKHDQLTDILTEGKVDYTAIFPDLRPEPHSGSAQDYTDYEHEIDHKILELLKKSRKEAQPQLKKLWETEKQIFEKVSAIQRVPALEKAWIKWCDSIKNYLKSWGDERTRYALVISYIEYCNKKMSYHTALLRKKLCFLDAYPMVIKKKILEIAREKYGYTGNGYISSYAQTNSKEWFAEVFSHAMCSAEPNPLGLAALDWLAEKEAEFVSDK